MNLRYDVSIIIIQNNQECVKQVEKHELSLNWIWLQNNANILRECKQIGLLAQSWKASCLLKYGILACLKVSNANPVISYSQYLTQKIPQPPLPICYGADVTRRIHYGLVCRLVRTFLTSHL